MTGCNFLDKEPDLRADINTKKKVQLLLTSAYDMPNYGTLGEVMSDNTVDNNTPDASGHVNSKVPMNTLWDDYFAWEPARESQQDSPYAIWQGCYSNIAVANQALVAIEKLEEEGQNMRAERAEALMIRAYNHFILANVFCKAYRTDELSKNDLGVHYMTQAETTVKPEYDRSNVTEVYKHIEADLLAALPDIEDSYYAVPKYHFNQKAAYAFAARFYLFKRDYDKVLFYANKVLGTTPAEAAAVMWDAATAKEMGNSEQESFCWIDAKSPANLLVCTTSSFQVYAFIPDYARYSTNRAPLEIVLSKNGGPNWSGAFPGANLWRYDANYGSFFCKIKVFFEYTDKIAGIGYGHTMRRELTTGETLMARAEAKIMKGDLSGALADMNVWTHAYCIEKDLTESNITTFFAGSHPQKSPTLNNEKMDPNWVLPGDKNLSRLYMLCCLHLRRIENFYDGTRWFDLKRWGIEIDHEIGYPVVTKHLSWDDDRRAVQLPNEAILAGQQPNPRAHVGDNNSVVTTGTPNVDMMTAFAIANTMTITKE